MNLNRLYYGDCLDWMRRWQDECVDLIYLDPPFNSNAAYSILFGTRSVSQAQDRAFKDTWYWDAAAVNRYKEFKAAIGRPAHKAIVGLQEILGDCGMLAYLTYMAERLEEMRRILKPMGSIYFHCDPTASHYLKIIMDAIFGNTNFRNEIVWGYERPYSGTLQFRKNHDTILFYSKSRKWIFNPQRVPLMDGTFELPKPFKRPDGTIWRPQGPGKEAADWWYDIPSFATLMTAKERLGYPTQKPLALLERIIKASSNEGDIVLDPFCGTGTTIEAADRLKRKWAGIDIRPTAIDLIRERRMKDQTIPVSGIPTDIVSAKKLAKESPFEFEAWAITRLAGFVPNTKQVADGGVDGRGVLFDQPDDWDSKLALTQVKGGKFTLNALRNFIGVINRANAAIGCFITLETVTSTSAHALVAEMGNITIGNNTYPRLNLWSIEDYYDDRPCPLPPMTDPYTGQPLKPTQF